MTDVIKLPSGIRLPVAEGQTPDEVLRIHDVASLSEGICPRCAARLSVAEGDSAQTPGTGLPWLCCVGCLCYWQLNVATQTMTWEAGWAWQGLPHPCEQGWL